MFPLFLSLFFIAAQNILPILAASSLKVVDLGYAKYQSDLNLTDGVTSFLGMRYAAPPTGHLRWKNPQAPAKVTGVHNATTQPHQCFQASIAGSAGTSPTSPFKNLHSHKRDTDGVSDEDCLFLNVHTPTAPKHKSLLPVIVYMHGGGWDAGNVSLYPLQDSVKAANYGVVTVSIQYRLGLFGFLSGEKVKDGGVLNAGLLDQNFALQWVQKHIASFGGDKTKVTIWGQSAGAGSMLQHIVAHKGNTQPPLFRAVLMNSPYLAFQYHYNDPIPEKLYSEVLSMVNCTCSKDSLDCLRRVDASLLLDADTKIGFAGFLGTYSFIPVVDGSFIVESPSLTLKRGRVNGKALLVSTNSNEGLLFAPPDFITANNFTITDYITQLFPRMNDKQVQQAAGIYSNLGLSTVADQASAVMGESLFVCAAQKTVSAFGKHGWKIAFAIPPGTHALDLSYEFATFGIPPTFNNSDFLNAFQQAFMSTAMSLDPNVHFDPTNITPAWPSWSNHTEMLFNKTVDDKPVVRTISTDAGLLKRCEYWSTLTDINSQ